ncbi:ATP-binding protein [Labrenzia sp. PHM005]|uniref:ATP-binding protein n=1 Tax=Labrenzia sp. PHM005 TaxID=2590016 RepID=UPI00143D3133|nr:ATP-binding protein [Labrenzia sp. PHM005]
MTTETVVSLSSATVTQTDAERLIIRYKSLFFGGILLLTALAVGFGFLQARQISERLIQDARAHADLLHKGLSDQLDVAREHVGGMRHALETVLGNPVFSSQGKLSGALIDMAQNAPKGAMWDTLPKVLRNKTGTLFSSSNARDFEAELDDVLWAAPLMWNAHMQHPEFQWSYYYDEAGDYSVLFPGLDFKDLSSAMGKTNMDEILRTIYAAGGTFPVQLVGPEKNPERKQVWTPPYPDAAAAGLMVSLLSPVYREDDFIGAYGADITLSVLNDLLSSDAVVGNIWVIAEDGDIVATSKPAKDAGTRISKLFEKQKSLSAEEVFDTSSGVLNIDSHGVWLTYSLEGTPWRMLLYISNGELRSTVLNLMTPYLATTILCVATMIGLVLLQHKRFTVPALQLARHVESLPQQLKINSPHVPGHWQALFGRANSTEQERRDAVHDLRNLNADLEVRVAERAKELTEANEELSKTVEELRETQDQLVKAEKLASLGALVAGVAHELNTPIGNALMMASSLADKNRIFQEAVQQPLNESTLTEFADMVDACSNVLLRSLGRADELVTSFKKIAIDQTSYKKRVFQLSDVIDEINITLGPTLKQANATVECDLEDGLELDSYPGPLGQVLLNLYNNALIHGLAENEGGQILVRARRLGDNLNLVVSDNGQGIEEENLNKVFDPFFTTKLGQGGSGLGLHIVYNFITDLLGGTIVAESTWGSGTRFTIDIPLTAPERKNVEI